jgi:uncharacterized alpha-E superfamily protein
MWRVLTSLNEFPDEVTELGEVLDLINRHISTLAAFGGLAMESMTRSQGWRFLDMGRRLERSLHLLRLLFGTLIHQSPAEGNLLEAVLEIADSLMTYRRRYLSSLQAAPVLDLLLADESNPRSLAFQLVSLMEDVEALPREANSPGRSAEERLMLSCVTTLRLAEISELSEVDSKGLRTRLAELLSKLETDLWKLSDTITQHYLIHLQRTRHLAV